MKRVRRLLRDGLECEMTCVADGESAVRSAMSSRPDLVLLDYALPNLNGLDVCRALKGDDRTRSVPVCVISALDRDDIVGAALAAGADDFISKPIHASELRLRVLLLTGRVARQTLICAAAEELARARRESLQIASLVAHELRGPLTLLVTNLDFLESNADPVDCQSLIAGCHDAVKHLTRSVENLTLRATLEGSGGAELHDIVDLNAAVAQVAADVMVLCRSRELRLELDLNAAPLTVTGDRALLTSLLTNTLINAAEQSPTHGRIVVRTRADADRAEVVVEDEGPPPALGLEHLLTDSEAVAALKSGHARTGKGLCLDVTHGVADLHGGAVTIERSGQRGMRVRIQLPLRPERASEATEVALRPIRLGLDVRAGDRVLRTYTTGLSPASAQVEPGESLPAGEVVDVNLVEFPTAQARARVGSDATSLEWNEWNDVFVRIVTLVTRGSLAC